MSKINGIPVGATIVPIDTLDTYSTHTEEYGKGGYRTVQTIQDRDAIPLDRLKVGMKVLVYQEKNIYYLKSLDNNTPVWELDTYLYSDQLLVSPTLQRTWTFYKFDGTTEVAANKVNKNNPSMKNTDSYVTIESGFKANYAGQFKWASQDGKKNPTSCSGDLGTQLPNDNVWSAMTNINGIAQSRLIKETITAAKKGFMVSGSSVVVASGSDSTSAQDGISFQGRYYYGTIVNKDLNSITADDIKALANSNLTTARNRTIMATTKPDNSLLVYAYPASYGNLTNIIQDKAIPVLSAFDNKQIDITNDAGYTYKYIVYMNTNKGVFNNNELVFS